MSDDNKKIKRYFYASLETNQTIRVFGFVNIFECVNWIEETNKDFKYISGKPVAFKINRAAAEKYTQTVTKRLSFEAYDDRALNPNSYQMFSVVESS
jgi:hypothetical protein